ncbi:hypothetical protein [Pedobacter endophyticus]|uniref:DUF3575 domain-containing protein n=1 Tax=Pedobacter endophyticus TaxID=2789740 RepID=A0A7S9L0A6_9SPHI|nr:hypothetical protein [Pedobacter endophyticus]QPH39904.1 hypothetical protein IZT61_01050 [Pedobacter endophyticus]
MKKTILTTILISTIILAKAQTGETGKVTNPINEKGKNELKINLLTSVLALPEISYERILEDNMSVGISLAAGIGNEDDFSEYRFLAIPHYRLYFGKKRAAGFFIEGNAAVGSVREDHWAYYQNGFNVAYSSNVVNFGLGAAVGAKFLTRNGFLGEVFGGVGRFLSGNRTVEAYPRVGITLGKRF